MDNQTIKQEITKLETRLIKIDIKERKIITFCLISIIGIWLIPIIVLMNNSERNTIKETTRRLTEKLNTIK